MRHLLRWLLSVRSDLRRRGRSSRVDGIHAQTDDKQGDGYLTQPFGDLYVSLLPGLDGRLLTDLAEQVQDAPAGERV